MILCGVTREPLTYWLLAAPDELIKIPVQCRAKVEMGNNNPNNPGWVFPSPWAVASIASFLAIFCLRKERRSNSTTEIGWLDAIFEKENLLGSRDHPRGEGMLGNARTVVVVIN